MISLPRYCRAQKNWISYCEGEQKPSFDYTNIKGCDSNSTIVIVKHSHICKFNMSGLEDWIFRNISEWVIFG